MATAKARYSVQVFLAKTWQECESRSSKKAADKIALGLRLSGSYEAVRVRRVK